MTREEAIYWLDHSDLNRAKFYEAVGWAIEALERTRWIPVMEKLPEKDGKYLVWAVMSYTPDHADEPCDYQQIAIASFLSGKYGSDFYGNNLEKVIGWMPLPDPYVPQESEDKE